jgi:hypothetical protein
MDRKRAAIIASAGVGLLVSAFALRKWYTASHAEPNQESYSGEGRAVVLTDGQMIPHKNRHRKRMAKSV